jgi:kinesin family protein 4/21/27
MRLQEVLKERETEIRVLEESLKESQANQLTGQDRGVVISSSEIQDSVASVTGLSPKTLNNFDQIKQTMVNGNVHTANPDHTSNHSESDESLERLNELMLYVKKYQYVIHCV